MTLKFVTNRKWLKSSKKMAFTLPEVIISFTILAMVVTSAVSLLSLVIRTNSDNVSSLVANGLAQEGIEAIRFIRDSDVILGLDFDGGREGNVNMVWGGRLYDSTFAEAKYFTLINKKEVNSNCSTMDLEACLPVEVQELSGIDLDQLAEIEDTQIYLDKSVDGGFSRYFQKGGNGMDLEGTFTPYHRVIRIEPLKVPESNVDVNALRVSSIVFWPGVNNMPKKLVLTTELTDWR